LNSEQIRLLKHELRTPINHILGYSELLLETAADSNDTAVEQLAETIRRHGRDLAAITDRHLNEIAGNTEAVVEALRATALPHVNAILNLVRKADTAAGETVHDLNRIEAAVERLGTLLSLQPPADSFSAQQSGSLQTLGHE
jgi:signal transduction histidine kinase